MPFNPRLRHASIALVDIGVQQLIFIDIIELVAKSKKENNSNHMQ
jgi:hypothetical protein